MRDRVQQALADVYRDLHNRRLLLPALALVVAIVAVPLLLKSDPSSPPPPASAADGTSGATAAEPAVLTEQTGIRDYRKRLAELKERNPFESPFETPERGGSNGGQNPETAIAPAADSGVPPTTIADPTAVGTGSTVADTSQSSDSTGSSSSSSGGSEIDVGVQLDEPAPNTSDDPPPEASFYAERVDVAVGTIGHNKDLEGVSPLDPLPDKHAEVAVFVGLTDGGQTALFKVSRDVTDTNGQGSCTPHKPKACRFLTLEPGQDRYLKYEPNGKTYRLKVIEVYTVAVAE